MTIWDRIAELEAAIRKHRDYRGDDRCWRDDVELYAVLRDGWTIPECDTSVDLENCRRFIECRKNPYTKYVSPQRRIEELEKRQVKLEEIVARLPKSADGVPVICDGMVLYCPRGHATQLTYAAHNVYCCQGECFDTGCQGDSGRGTYYPFSVCRTTQEVTND